MVVLRRHEQYATKADFRVLSHGVKTQLDQLEGKTDRLETKADRLEEKTDRLEANTSRLEMKTDRLEAKVDHLDEKVDHLEVKVGHLDVKVGHLDMKVGHLDVKVGHLEVKVDHLGERISQFEVKVTSDLVGLKGAMTINADECKSEISKLRADVAVLTNSHKYVLWIGGGLATMCMSVFGLCISILLPSLRW